MIPDLLWRCPLCAANDALVHTRRWPLPDRVSCTRCGARWRVRRIPGDNFYLKLTRPPRGASLPTIERLSIDWSDKMRQILPIERFRTDWSDRMHQILPVERSITAWYDEMKKTLRLEPANDPQARLAPGERLYLASRTVELWLEPGQPPYLLPPASPPHRPSQDETAAILSGRGRLFLTDRRLAWQAEDVESDFPLDQIRGAYTILNRGLAIAGAGQLFFFNLLQESPLKWVTYLGMLANGASTGSASGTRPEPVEGRFPAPDASAGSASGRLVTSHW